MLSDVLACSGDITGVCGCDGGLFALQVPALQLRPAQQSESDEQTKLPAGRHETHLEKFALEGERSHCPALPPAPQHCELAEQLSVPMGMHDWHEPDVQTEQFAAHCVELAHACPHDSFCLQ